MTTAASLYLANIPSPDRGVWDLDLGALTIPIRAYALCIIVGIIVAIWWGERRFVARGGRKGDVLDIAVYAVPFGLVGGRLYHVATDYYRYFGAGKNPLNALKVWDGGLGIWGAIALGGVGAWIGCRQKGVPLAVFADAVAPGHSSPHRPSAASATTSTRSSTAGPPTCRGAWRSTSASRTC